MASHLTAQQTGTSSSDSGLVCHGDHLLTVVQSRSWSSQTLVVTPQRELNTCVATSALYNINNAAEVRKASAYMDMNDWNGMLNDARLKFGQKTVESWNDGYKPCFLYWDRGYMPRGDTEDFLEENTADPWWCYCNAPGLRDNPGNYWRNCGLTFGCGGSWSALYFNLYWFPLKKCSSLDISLRIYNPSWVVYDSYQTGGNFVYRQYESVNDTNVKMQYNVFGELPAVAEIDNEERPSAKINIGTAGVSNQGHVGVSPFPIRDQDNTDGLYVGSYDPWNLLTERSVRQIPSGAFRSVPIYHAGESTSDYYKDISLDSTVKQRLFDIMKSGNGGFWFLVGPVLSDFNHPNFQPGLCAMAYFSRVELILKISIGAFNS